MLSPSTLTDILPPSPDSPVPPTVWDSDTSRLEDTVPSSVRSKFQPTFGVSARPPQPYETKIPSTNSLDLSGLTPDS